MSDVMDFINSAGSGFDTVKFNSIGDKVDGKIINPPRVIEKRNDNTGAMDKILVIDLHTVDDEDRTLMCGAGGRVSALRDALQKAGAAGLEVGGRIVMQYTEDGPKTPGKPQAPKNYKAAYETPKPSATSVDDLLS